jgi:hypothetical protein
MKLSFVELDDASFVEAVQLAEAIADANYCSIFLREISPGSWRMRAWAPYYHSAEVRIDPD